MTEIKVCDAKAADPIDHWGNFSENSPIGDFKSRATAMTRHFSKPSIADDPASAKTLVVDLRRVVALDPDPDKQATLRRILIEEEDKLAEHRERLDNSERLIRKGKQQLCEGTEHIERLKKSAGNNADFKRTLELMKTMQQLFENFHRRQLDVYPYHVKLHDEIVGIFGTLDEARRRAQQFADGNAEAFVSVVDARDGRSETFYQKLS